MTLDVWRWRLFCGLIILAAFELTQATPQCPKRLVLSDGATTLATGGLYLIDAPVTVHAEDTLIIERCVDILFDFREEDDSQF